MKDVQKNSLSIAMDASTATRQLGGISEYTYRLLEALGAIDQTDQFSLLTFGKNPDQLLPLPSLPANFTRYHKRLPQKALEFFWRYFDQPGVTGWIPPHDIFFTPHFLVPAGNFRRLVITVHDVLFLDHPEWFQAGDVRYYTQKLTAAVNRANHIITVSEESKSQLLAHQLVTVERVTVIPEGVEFEAPDIDVLKQTKQKYNLPDNYLLFIGTLEPRKNILRILDAYAKLKKMAPRPPLVLAGRRGWLDQTFEAKLRELQLGNSLILIDNFARSERSALLACASMLVFPSLAEGFGLPVLEGMAAGVPVITSALSSLPEVAGDAALLIDPLNTEALAEAMDRLLNNPLLRAQLVAAGRKRAKEYTWRRTAEMTLELFRKLVDHE